MVNTRGWIHVRDDRFSKFRNRKNLRSLIRLLSDAIINWPRATRAANNAFDPLSLAKRHTLITCQILGILTILPNNAMESEDIAKI